MSTTQPDLRQARNALDQLAELEHDPEQEARARLAEVERDVVQVEMDDAATPEYRARVRAGQRADAARDYRSLRERLIQRADDNAADAATIAREDSPDWKQYWELTARAHHNLAVAERLEGREREHRTAARVVSEPPLYGPGSPHSWTLDVAMATDPNLAPVMAARAPDMSQEAVEERLAKHARDLGRAAISPGDPWGKQIRSMFHERTRHEDPAIHKRNAEQARIELRTLGTGGGSTASAATGASVFVSPYFLLTSWAPFRGIQRAFVDQCRAEDLPPYGMEVYVPVFTAGTSASQQTEGSGVSEATPTTGLEGAEVKNVAGMLIITEQLSARGFTGGHSFDELVGRQIQEQLDQEIDKYVLSQAITNGEAVTGATEYKTAKLYEDMAKAREKLTDTAGTRLRPTHFFTTSDFFSFVSRQVDATTERPIFQPWYVTGYPAETQADDYDGKPEPPFSRFMSAAMPGGVLWMSDDNIPAVGTTAKTQLIMSSPGVSITVCEGEPYLGVFRETFANELRVVVQLRAYVAAVTRHKAGTAVISGEGYKTTQV
jgi:hypothetical protein